jgi:ADP-ribosylglycohydrolase
VENSKDIPDLEKKLRGYLFGAACADALGRPVEHLRLEQIKRTTEKKAFLKSLLILHGLTIPN